MHEHEQNHKLDELNEEVGQTLGMIDVDLKVLGIMNKS